MRIYYAGFYNLKADYMEPIKDIKVLHVLRSYYYKHDLDGFLKKLKEYRENEQGVTDGDQSGEALAEPAELDRGGGERGLS